MGRAAREPMAATPSKPRVKRKRMAEAVEPAELMEEAASSAHYASKKLVGRPPRLPSLMNIVLLAGHRLLAHDFDGAAAVLPLLMNQALLDNAPGQIFHIVSNMYSQDKDSRTLQKENVDPVLLRHLIRHQTTPPGAKAQAAIQLGQSLVREGNLKQAVDQIRDLSTAAPFSSSPKVHAYLASLLLSLSHTPAPGHLSRSVLISFAANELAKAASLAPAEASFQISAAALALSSNDYYRAISLLREFLAANPGDLPAHHALLLTLKSGPSSRSNLQERVNLARHALSIDPTASYAIELLQEAASWNWPVDPRVGQPELAGILASAVEIQAGTNSSTECWSALATALSKVSSKSLLGIWHENSRSRWWPSHFFRASSAATDLSRGRAVATAKARVASLFMGHYSDYPKEVAILIGRDSSCV